MKYRIPKHIAGRAVGDEFVVLDMKKNRYFGLNPTAAFIWKALVDGEGQTAVARYAETYRVPIAQAEDDFRRQAEDFVKRGFLTAS